MNSGTDTIIVSKSIWRNAYRVKNTSRILYIRFDGKYYVAAVRSMSKWEDIYIIRVSADGTRYYCTCTYNMVTGRPCKHIVSVLFELNEKRLLKVKMNIKCAKNNGQPKPPSALTGSV